MSKGNLAPTTPPKLTWFPRMNQFVSFKNKTVWFMGNNKVLIVLLIHISSIWIVHCPCRSYSSVHCRWLALQKKIIDVAVIRRQPRSAQSDEYSSLNRFLIKIMCVKHHRNLFAVRELECMWKTRINNHLQLCFP